jgi:hypothetical protein
MIDESKAEKVLRIGALILALLGLLMLIEVMVRNYGRWGWMN